MKGLEKLSALQRRLTPVACAHWLIELVRARTGSYRVAALWVDQKGPYPAIDGVECWNRERDAVKYAGPWPIIAHPPCGPWGRYRANCKQDRRDGIIAMELVHRFGGVVEQPQTSRLFREHGQPFAEYTQFPLALFGFACLKPTTIYMWWLTPPEDKQPPAAATALPRCTSA